MKKQTQSVSGVVDVLQGHCAIAKIWVTDFTLFSNTCLNAAEVNILIHQAWSHDEDKHKLLTQRPKEASALVIHCSFHPSRPITDSLQFKSIHSHIPSYIIYESRQRVLRLYRLEYQSKEDLARDITWLLDGYRFSCRQDSRQVS